MADINITITIPEEWAPDVQEAFNGQADKPIGLTFETAHKNYTYAPRDITGGETQLQFAQRVIRTHLKQQVIIFKKSVDQVRWETEINSVDPVLEDIPEDIFLASK